MARLFIAVDLPAPLRDLVGRLCAGISNARWINPDQAHITLRFLGDTPEAQIDDLRGNLLKVAATPFELALAGVGVFPQGGRKPARVLWIGIDPLGPLRALKEAVDQAIGTPDPETAGRGYSPHLTLARFPTPAPRNQLADFLQQHAGVRSQTWSVAEFYLYRSTLRPQGAVHERLAVYPLR